MQIGRPLTWVKMKYFFTFVGNVLKRFSPGRPDLTLISFDLFNFYIFPVLFPFLRFSLSVWVCMSVCVCEGREREGVFFFPIWTISSGWYEALIWYDPFEIFLPPHSGVVFNIKITQSCHKNIINYSNKISI